MRHALIINILILAGIIAWLSIIFIPRLVHATTTDSEVITIEYDRGCEGQETIQDYAKCRVAEEWDESQWDSFNNIIKKESANWTVTGNHNLELSSAFGLMGFLNGTWSTVGCVKSSDEMVQIDCGIKYIKQRYGTPKEAWKEHKRKNWY